MGGRAVSPESFTHGTSAQREEWFKKSLEGGTIQSCPTTRRENSPLERLRLCTMIAEMSGATATAISAALIGAISSLTGVFVGALAQQRLMMKQLKMVREEEERKREEGKRRADNEEREALLRSLTDLRLPPNSRIKHLLPSRSSFFEHELGRRDLDHLSTEMLRQISCFLFADIHAEGLMMPLFDKLDRVIDSLGQVVGDVTKESDIITRKLKDDIERGTDVNKKL